MKTKPFDIAEHLKTDNDIAEFLNALYEDYGIEAVLEAMDTVIRAKGITDIANKTGLSRESLYKTFKHKRQPKISTVFNILNALGINIKFKAA